MITFPVFKDTLNTLSNWAPKLADQFARLFSRFSFGSWKLEISGYGTLIVSSYNPLRSFHVRIWKVVFFIASVNKIVLSGSASPWMYFTLPVLPTDEEYREATFIGRGSNGSATISLMAFITGGRAAVQTYDATNWSTGSDRDFSVSGFYFVNE